MTESEPPPPSRPSPELRLNAVQRLRTRMHLFLVAVRKRMTVGVRAVLIDGDKVLLVKHTYMPGWHFPGGSVEVGEPAETSAGREAFEETGYAVEGRPDLLGFYLHRLAGTERDYVAVYVWRRFHVARPFKRNLEIAECAWFPITALPPDVPEGTRRRLRELFEGVPAAAEW